MPLSSLRITGALLLLSVAACSVAAAGPPTMYLVSASPTGSGNGESGFPVISGDGSVVVFESLASDLVPGLTDSNGNHDVFARNLDTGVTTLVSVNESGTGSGNGTSLFQGVSDNGRYVVFVSEASDLEPLDEDSTLDVFVRDLQQGSTQLVSVNAAGNGSGNNPAGDPVITPDGRFVAFSSAASDLTPGDTSPFQDVYVRDLVTQTTTLVSVNAAGDGTGNQTSNYPRISANGRYVAFLSLATNLTPGVPPGTLLPDVFWRDLWTGTTVMVSATRTGAPSDTTGSPVFDMTPDGRFVAFPSTHPEMVAGIQDANGTEDIFVRDLLTGELRLVSINLAGTGTGNSTSSAVSISADGSLVAFSGTASDLVPNDHNNTFDVFVRDVARSTTRAASLNAAGTATAAGGGSTTPVLSADGRFVAFSSAGIDLVPEDSSGVQDVYRHDLANSSTKLVSERLSGGAAGNHVSYAHVTSRDGRVIAFRSLASDLTANDTNGFTVDVFAARLNSAPVARDDRYFVPQNSPLSVPAGGVLTNDTDLDGDARTAVLVDGPAHGTLSLNADGSFTYTRTPGYMGSDQFTYRATDGTDSSAAATVRIDPEGARSTRVIGAGGWRPNSNFVVMAMSDRAGRARGKLTFLGQEGFLRKGVVTGLTRAGGVVRIYGNGVQQGRGNVDFVLDLEDLPGSRNDRFALTTTGGLIVPPTLITRGGFTLR